MSDNNNNKHNSQEIGDKHGNIIWILLLPIVIT
jgi:hypothetical protein